MYEQPTPFQNFWRNTTPTQKFAIFLIPVAIIIIIAIAIISIINNQSQKQDFPNAYHVTITNFDITGAAEDYRLLLQDSLWEKLQFNYVPLDTVTEAQIREDSFFQTTVNDFYRSTFLVDIPTLQKTFDIILVWPINSKNIDTSADDEYSISIYCPNYTDVIYEDSTCYLSNDPYDSIDQYLPYAGYYADDGLSISIKQERYTENSDEDSDESTTLPFAGEKFLWITINTCNNPDLLYEGKNYITNWLRQRLVDPSLFLTEYYEYCE